VQWVVVFAGSRDRYQVPLALAEANCLEALVTDCYAPLDGFAGTLFTHLPQRATATLRRRYAYGLRSQLVRWRLTTFLVDYLRQTSHAERDRRLGRIGGSLARRHEAGLISYSYYGYHAFHSYGLERRPKVLFQVHPHPVSVRRLLAEELQLSELGGTSLQEEPEFSIVPQRLEELSREAFLADRCIVASSFAKRTLVENGIAEERVAVVPYGVDIDRFALQWPETRALFRVVFVGQMVQRKGLEYLLKAWRQLRLPNAELVLAGRGRVDQTLLREFNTEFRYLGPVSDADLSDLYSNSDLFCMPSLVEGFGLVYLEALAAGLPIIATPNTGAADILQDGREGFVVPIRDVNALASRIEWAYSHRDELHAMRTAARTLAERFSWSTFRRRIAEELGHVGTLP
jgi:glycosyltransferase involved in cell wall biosynthesis